MQMNHQTHDLKIMLNYRHICTKLIKLVIKAKNTTEPFISQAQTGGIFSRPFTITPRTTERQREWRFLLFFPFFFPFSNLSFFPQKGGFFAYLLASLACKWAGVEFFYILLYFFPNEAFWQGLLDLGQRVFFLFGGKFLLDSFCWPGARSCGNDVNYEL